MAATVFIWDSASDSCLCEIGSNGDHCVNTTEPTKHGAVVSRYHENSAYYYHFDVQGSTRKLTNSVQQTTGSYVYDSFGTNIYTNETVYTPYRYNGASGYYTDNGTGYIYVRARIYDSYQARWFSLDPRYRSHTRNDYRYASNNPIGANDPSGLFDQKVVGNACSETCGKFAMVTEWTLDPGQTDGFIVQKVCRRGHISICPPLDPSTTVCRFRNPPGCKNSLELPTVKGANEVCYYEVWRVHTSPGAATQIFWENPFSDPPGPGTSGVDVFGFFGCAGECDSVQTFGSFRFTGTAHFIPMPSDDDLMNLQKEFMCPGFAVACSLCTATGKSVGDLVRKLSRPPVRTKRAHIDWNCCGCDCPSINKPSVLNVDGVKGPVPADDSCAKIEKKAGVQN